MIVSKYCEIILMSEAFSNLSLLYYDKFRLWFLISQVFQNKKVLDHLENKVHISHLK